MAMPHQRHHWLVRAIVGSFGDQLPRVGVGQRFRISMGLPDVNKVQTLPRPVPAELAFDPPLGNTDERNGGKDSATGVREPCPHKCGTNNDSIKKRKWAA